VGGEGKGERKTPAKKSRQRGLTLRGGKEVRPSSASSTNGDYGHGSGEENRVGKSGSLDDPPPQRRGMDSRKKSRRKTRKREGNRDYRQFGTNKKESAPENPVIKNEGRK